MVVTPCVLFPVVCRTEVKVRCTSWVTLVTVVFFGTGDVTGAVLSSVGFSFGGVVDGGLVGAAGTVGALAAGTGWAGAVGGMSRAASSEPNPLFLPAVAR